MVLRINVSSVDAEDGDDEEQHIVTAISPGKLQLMEELAKLISDGSDTFLFTEFAAIGVFIVLFSILLIFVVEK